MTRITKKKKKKKKKGKEYFSKFISEKVFSVTGLITSSKKG